MWKHNRFDKKNSKYKLQTFNTESKPETLVKKVNALLEKLHRLKSLDKHQNSSKKTGVILNYFSPNSTSSLWY